MTRLAGKTVLVTRAREQAADLCDALSIHGARPVLFPTIEIRPPSDAGPLDHAIDRLEQYTWVLFTSVNGVAAFWSRFDQVGRAWPAAVRLAAIGPATAAALRARGTQVHVMPAEYRAERLAESLPDITGGRVLLPRAERVREALAQALRARGADVDEVTAYRTLPTDPDQSALSALRSGVDVATFTSASTVTNFDLLLGGAAAATLARSVVACIGPVTADAARDLGIRVDVQAGSYTIPGLVQAILEHYGRCV